MVDALFKLLLYVFNKKKLKIFFVVPKKIHFEVVRFETEHPIDDYDKLIATGDLNFFEMPNQPGIGSFSTSSLGGGHSCQKITGDA